MSRTVTAGPRRLGAGDAVRPAPAAAIAAARYARPVEVVDDRSSVVALDQLTQADRPADAAAARRAVNVIPGLLDLTHVQNTGAAFGLLNAADFPYKPAVMIGIAAHRAGRDCRLRARSSASTSGWRASGCR